MTDWNQTLNDLLQTFICDQFPIDSHLAQPGRVIALVAIVLVTLVCGGVGSLVVGNRMAFFSDALAHCAFAGVGLGLLLGFLTGGSDDLIGAAIPAVMVVLGILFGLGNVFVRESTGQASDTVIGVFFAGAIALGAIFLQAGSHRRYMPPEDFLFGNLVLVSPVQLIVLLLLVIVTAASVCFLYNQLVFSSFSRSLALSRRIPVVTYQYLFIALLAVVVNLCLLTVGALLINGLLIVPAATAAIVSRNMRQLFWLSIGLCTAVGLGGLWLSWNVRIPGPRESSVNPSEGGTIVLLAVIVYFAAMLLRSNLKSQITNIKWRSRA